MSDMVQVGFIGFGGHVRKNVVRCFGAGSGRQVSGIYVRRAAHYREAFPDFAGQFTERLDDLLDDPAISAIYIATPIAAHFGYALAALEAGKSVWCEKPLTDRMERTEQLAALAAQRGLMLAEVAMYRRHAQFAAIQALLASKTEAGEALISAQARFAIPQLSPDDFRYDKEAGGGALLDVGYYPLSMASSLFGIPQWVAAVGRTAPQSTSDVDLSGSALLAYGSFGFHASWAIGSSYANVIELHFEASRYVLSPAFSKPPTLRTEIQAFNAAGQAQDSITVEPDDQFMNFFDHLTAGLARKDLQAIAGLAKDAVQTAGVIEAVRNDLERRTTCGPLER